MDYLYLKFIGLTFLTITIGLFAIRVIMGEVDQGLAFTVAIISSMISARWYGDQIKKLKT